LGPLSAALTLRIEQELVSSQSFLERRAHERVAWSGVLQNLEVDPEEGQVDHERENDETDSSIQEVTVKVGLRVNETSLSWRM
jgi:hypothetical protein